MAYTIRTYGDPVLKSQAAAITDVDGKLNRYSSGISARATAR